MKTNIDTPTPTAAFALTSLSITNRLLKLYYFFVVASYISEEAPASILPHFFEDQFFKPFDLRLIKTFLCDVGLKSHSSLVPQQKLLPNLIWMRG